MTFEISMTRQGNYKVVPVRRGDDRMQVSIALEDKDILTRSNIGYVERHISESLGNVLMLKPMRVASLHNLLKKLNEDGVAARIIALMDV